MEDRFQISSVYTRFGNTNIGVFIVSRRRISSVHSKLVARGETLPLSIVFRASRENDKGAIRQSLIRRKREEKDGVRRCAPRTGAIIIEIGKVGDRVNLANQLEYNKRGVRRRTTSTTSGETSLDKPDSPGWTERKGETMEERGRRYFCHANERS